MVRIPIPSWEEMEACRTYGSQFEKVEGRQMFRVPFMMGKQESLVSTVPEDAPFEGTQGIGEDSEKSKQNFNDPWGLERTNDKTADLGQPLGADVASLRHVRITREAAKFWQSYDAFARVALTIGINQLILTLSYYYLAYLVIDVDCKGAGICAVLFLIVMADACFKIEMSLQTWQLTVAQFFGILGPICGLVAAYHTDLDDLSNIAAHWWIPFAFFAHGLYLFFLVYLCKVKMLRSGITVPAAFKQKLYLDVFGWIKPRPHKNEPSIFGLRKGEGELVSQPALEVMRYENGKSRPTTPYDFAVTHDLRDEQGAPNHAVPIAVDSKSDINFFKWEPERTREGDDPESIVTGNDAQGPGIFPWMVFSYGLTFLSMVWMAAGVWRLEQAFVVTRHAVSWTQMTQMTQSERVSALLESSTRIYPGDVREVLSGNSTPYLNDPAKLEDASLPDLFDLWVSGYVGKPRMELVSTAWPHARFTPRTLSCDSSGQHFVVTDRFSAVEASLPQNGRQDVMMNFAELSCPTLVGEHLQDTSLSCSDSGKDSSCNVFVLHRHGKRIASCKLRGAAKANVSDISESWLERDDASKAEKVSAIALSPLCGGDLAHCMIAHTTHGRTVQLRKRSQGSDLVPDEVLQEGNQGANTKQIGTSVLRAFNRRYVGVLHQQRQSIEILDVVRGGLMAGKLLLPPQQHVTSWCAGGRHLYVLSDKQVWRVPLPEKLSTM
jgi:hypothetical protein